MRQPVTFDQYVESVAKKPFLLRAACMWFIHNQKGDDPDTQRSRMRMATIARAMLGLMQLEVEMEWNKFLKSQPFWKRKEIALGRDEWIKSTLIGREAMAMEEVDMASLEWE